MVPEPRALYRVPIRWLRRSRLLALLLGILVGVGVTGLSWRYAHPGWGESLLLAVGFGGSTYYFAHYASADIKDEPFLRKMLRIQSMVLLAFTYMPHDGPFADRFVPYATICGVILLTMSSTAVSARFEETATDEGSDNSSGEPKGSTAPDTKVTAD